MKKKYISVKDLRFLVKALQWASQDRQGYAEIWNDDESREVKQAIKEGNQCLALREAINDHLKDGGKGLSCLYI